jgi:hypothetical protein
MPDRRWVHRLVEQFPLIDKERGKRSSGRYSGSQDPSSRRRRQRNPYIASSADSRLSLVEATGQATLEVTPDSAHLGECQAVGKEIVALWIKGKGVSFTMCPYRAASVPGPYASLSSYQG